MVNALWAYDDFTIENGATRVVPGSHRAPINREPPEESIGYAEMPRGSVLLYLGSVLHSGGANRSTRPRTAITMSYALGWLRQAENQYLAVPPALARTLPAALQKLIGYSIHAPNLGWYEGQDPGVVLERGFVDTLAAKDYMPPEIEAMLAERVRLLRSNAA
jgi:ectoine hydroxylase-related dioxygenase (phytanoyl-CoA dioxygenase family)